MSTDIEMLDTVRAWLRETRPVSGDRVLSAALSQLEEEPQLTPVSRTRATVRWPALASALVATAAVIVIAVGGIALLASRPSHGGMTASDFASPSPANSARPTRDPTAVDDLKIQEGPFSISTSRFAVNLTMPAGWLASAGETSVYRLPRIGWRGMVSLYVAPYRITHVVRDVCVNDADLSLEPIGPTAQDLTTALTSQSGFDRTGPIATTIGRYPAQTFELRLQPECADYQGGFVTDAALTYGFGLGPGDLGLVNVVDVDGEPLVIMGYSGPAASIEDVAQLRSIIDSAEVGLLPNGSPLPNLVPHGGLPAGRHGLTVDGVPLSFTVPPSVPDRGWARFGTFSVNFDSSGSQGAEALVYWTAFPDGAAIGPCPTVDLPRDGSNMELADSVASIDGTSLLAGPEDRTVGGSPARYVSLMVDEDHGCDPSFLFTSDAPPGGPGWWTTDAGDEIRVWIVDVNGRRMFIVGELKPAARESLRSQVDEIVASIAFE